MSTREKALEADGGDKNRFPAQSLIAHNSRSSILSKGRVHRFGDIRAAASIQVFRGEDKRRGDTRGLAQVKFHYSNRFVQDQSVGAKVDWDLTI